MIRTTAFVCAGLGFLLLWVVPAGAQWTWDARFPFQNSGMLGGLGYTDIDGQSYFVFRWRGELAFGRFGLGLDVPLRFSTADGRLRREDWNSTYAYFRTLLYLRYGTKSRTPVYARVGTLANAVLGHGFIMNHYTNEADYDNRKLGLVFDLRQRVWGIETVYSNFERVEIVGARAFVRPFRNLANFGLLRRVSFGATLVTDRNQDGDTATNDAVVVGGVDVELPLLYVGPFFSYVYGDYARIQNFGGGGAVGLALGLWKLGELLTVRAKLERRFLGKRFLPAYFDAFYEVQRFQVTPGGPIRKTDLLSLRTTETRGTYGELVAVVANFVRVLGTLELEDQQPGSGKLHLAAALSRAIPNVSLRALYDKTGIVNLKDAFTLDDRSMARLGFGYQLNAFMQVYFDYVWTFKFNEVTQRFESQERVEPHVAIVVPLPFGATQR